jgi:hypothetical protein
MPRFYQIVRLIEGRSIFPHPDKFLVDLDAARESDLIENDIAFGAAIAPGTWFWLSGGGTLLLNGRFLVLVQRSAQARVNPGKYSLFTGRADDEVERAEPLMLIRELFEELLLFEKGVLLAPQLDDWQPLVDRAHAGMREAGILGRDVAQRPLVLTPIRLPDSVMRIRHNGAARDHRFTWTASFTNDINALFLFGAQCDIDRLTARDGEFYRDDGGQVVRSERELYLYDLTTEMAHPLTSEGDARLVGRVEMTEPLQYLIGLCQRPPQLEPF